jgi:hypothetical protein
VYAQGSDRNDYFPDSMIQAWLVMFPFIIIIFVAVGCAFQLQSEFKFDAEKPRRF